MTERRYPTVTRTELERLTATLLEGVEPSTANSLEWQASSEIVDLGPLQEACDQALARLDHRTDADEKDKDRLEGEVAAMLYPALRALPHQVIDDPGFWRYLGLDLWALVSWREQLTEKNIRKYVDASNSTECVVLRMFLRAAAVYEDGDCSLTSAIPNGTDFWRSHVVRVRVSYSPAIARPHVMLQRDSRLMTKPLRDFARALNRVASNVVLPVYEEDEGMALVSAVRAPFVASGTSDGGTTGDE